MVWWQCSLASPWAIQPDEHGAATWHAYVHVYIYDTEHVVHTHTSTHQLKVGYSTGRLDGSSLLRTVWIAAQGLFRAAPLLAQYSVVEPACQGACAASCLVGEGRRTALGSRWFAGGYQLLFDARHCCPLPETELDRPPQPARHPMPAPVCICKYAGPASPSITSPRRRYSYWLCRQENAILPSPVTLDGRSARKLCFPLLTPPRTTTS